MKREIKFRAWDMDSKQIYDWDSISNLFNAHLEHDRVFVMQYTGLKDLNGVEIWEGDALYASGNLDTETFDQFVGFVEWDEHDARFEVVNMHGRFEYIPDGCVVNGHLYEEKEST